MPVQETVMEFGVAKKVLVLNGPHWLHPGYAPALERSYCEAARVCLTKFHKPPTDLAVNVHGINDHEILDWEEIDEQIRNSQANLSDAVCNGAYALSLLYVERKLNMVAVGRAEEGSGADWYIAPLGEGVDAFAAPDLDSRSIVRLEASGKLRGSIEARIKSKHRHLEAGQSSILGIVYVVGFEQPVVSFSS